MRDLVQRLYKTQNNLLSVPSWNRDHQVIVQNLRSSIPAPILAHYLRLIAQGRRGVALVRHGVCSECHIRVPSSLTATLVRPTSVHLCESCGRFLLLPDEEITSHGTASAPAAPRPRETRGAPLAA